MEEKSFTFVEKPDATDPGVYLHYLVSPGAQRASSVKDLVDKILSQLGPNDKIKTLRLIGHGSPGSISVGTSSFILTAPDNQDLQGRYIGRFNTREWVSELARLKGRFAQNSAIHLRSCNTGAGEHGAKLLHLIREAVDCGEVTAPTGVLTSFGAVGPLQRSKRGDKGPRIPISAGFTKKITWK